MPNLPHNQRAIDGLTAVDGKRTSYNSTVVTGLMLEVMPSGTKTWRFRYRTPGGRGGKTRTYTIGDARSIKLGPAVDRAREIKAAVQLEGRDPHKERYATDTSFGALFGDWLARHAKLKKKSWPHDEALYRRHIERRLGGVAANTIKRADLAQTLDEIARTATGIQANRCQSLISSVLNWAVNEGRLESSPSYRLPKRAAEAPRERILTLGELKAVWEGLASGPMGSDIERILRLLMLTGQRRSEVTEARKTEFDLDRLDPIWTIPGRRTKNGVMHQVPLTPLSAQLVSDALNDSGDSPFLFPGRGDSAASIGPHAVTRAMSRLVAQLGTEGATVHDLRRTVGTSLARLGVPKDIRARVLNHVDGARSVTDAVYNQHEFQAEKRAALKLWEDELRRVVAMAGGPSAEPPAVP